METQAQITGIKPGDHDAYMRLALSLATRSPPKPTNYRVGALVVDVATNEILATGYTLELPGNTHAEQCCIEKLAKQYAVDPALLSQALPDEVAIYTTVEPCILRLSGNKPCVERILDIGKSRVKTVYVGVQEPDTFVSGNSGSQRLKDAGIEVVHVPGLEDEILAVATAGHKAAT
ncbi:cytidine deaminase-like protein [Microdochium trichocladiopsis]|uniref:Cytidine deaminase-like protein n=1 Tax=Microdochium trichocladiopsis TaxID=1682393 RepID=A0A9P9BS34_9PEZI|nr:cytidine deaminase-like protein [Microdochium trichocladiopsis]KAH7027910.1 cytidine deaminase-like protein [Microdochium trichocladiopsis]